MVCPACNARYEGGQFCAKDGTVLVKDPNQSRRDLVGQIIADRYRVVKLLGEGGMGQVYEAQHVNINKRFAIKLLRPEIVANPEAVARFRQEAWSASSIGHENIVGIDDFATLPDGSVYLAMEYLSGESLADRMKRESHVSMAVALDVFAQVAGGLAAAHEKAIIHRDMKPENVFLAEKQIMPGLSRMVIKILDFGIAKVSGSEGSNNLTRTGAIFGTPHYMSPEQALGKPLDHRTDVYSVGVIMYEVFTGKVPFEAESFMGILTKHITSQPKRPREMAPERDIPADVESVIMRAMAKEPHDRYPSMADLLNDLIALVHVHAPQLLTPSGPQGLVPTPSAAHPLVSRAVPVIAQTMVAGDGREPTGSQRRSAPIAATLIADGTGPHRAMPASQPVAQVSQPMPAAGARDSQPLLIATPSQPFAVSRATPSQPLSSPSQPYPAASPSQSAPIVGDAPYAYPEAGGKKGGGIAVVIGIICLLALGGGAAAFLLLKKGPAPQPDPQPPPVAQPTPPPPAPAPSEIVVVDSDPEGARIMLDGKQVGLTPDAVKVPGGSTVKIVLERDGYIDEPVVVDPQKGRKMLVKLDRVSRSGKHASSSSKPKVPIYSSGPAVLPRPPATPVETPPPTIKPAPVPPPSVVKPSPVISKPRPKVVDPYERLDDRAPAKKDVLNPY